ncbi:probable G-protein coupled receptor 82 [Pelobates fuscus]|uniref:probable G-protein coupled receptor 82 n=1 Tax=Pelobates fuscus TaxID=191477 RepID=UPI002FE46B69
MWNNSSCLKPGSISTIGLPIIYSVMFLPSMIGNLITLWIFIRYITKKTSTHIYLINLAISNVMVSTGMPFQIAYYINADNWYYTSAKCSIVITASNILTHSSMCVSITIFCWIAISRYATVVRNVEIMPHTAQTSYEKILFGYILQSFRNPKFAKWLCSCVWIAILCPNVFFSSVSLDKKSNKLCFNEDVEIGKPHIRIGSMFESACYFIFIILVLLFYYFFIKHIENLQANSSIGEKYLVHSTVRRNIIVIILLLVICFAPYHCCKFLLYGLGTKCQLQSNLVEAKNMLLCLAEFRSCSDPIVYLCLDEVFKKNMQHLFGKAPDNSTNSTQANKRNTIQISFTNATVKQNAEISLTNVIDD